MQSVWDCLYNLAGMSPKVNMPKSKDLNTITTYNKL